MTVSQTNGGISRTSLASRVKAHTRVVADHDFVELLVRCIQQLFEDNCAGLSMKRKMDLNTEASCNLLVVIILGLNTSYLST